jgi:class 3 adenylate cyclase
LGAFASKGGAPVSKDEFMRRLTAILSEDLQGYSRLMADDEKATVRAINAYRGLMIGKINGHAGRLMDANGEMFRRGFQLWSMLFAVPSSPERAEREKLRAFGTPVGAY